MMKITQNMCVKFSVLIFYSVDDKPGMSFESESNCPQASQTCCDTPLFLGRTFQGSIFFSAFGVAAMGKDLRVENKFSWVYQRSRMY